MTAPPLPAPNPTPANPFPAPEPAVPTWPPVSRDALDLVECGPVLTNVGWFDTPMPALRLVEPAPVTDPALVAVSAEDHDALCPWYTAAWDHPEQHQSECAHCGRLVWATGWAPDERADLLWMEESDV